MFRGLVYFVVVLELTVVHSRCSFRINIIIDCETSWIVAGTGHWCHRVRVEHVVLTWIHSVLVGRLRLRNQPQVETQQNGQHDEDQKGEDEQARREEPATRGRHERLQAARLGARDDARQAGARHRQGQQVGAGEGV